MPLSLVFDIETNGLLPDVSRVHCIVAQNVESGEVHEFGPDAIEAGLALLSSASTLWGHNALSFDIPALMKVYPWWSYPHEQVRDTLVCSRLIWTDIKDRDFALRARHGPKAIPGNLMGRHSLEAWGHRLGEYKGDFGKTTDWSEWSPEMQKYCVQDVAVTLKLVKLIQSKNYSEAAITLEHTFRWLVDKQEAAGFCFDVAAAGSLYAKLAGRKAELEQELQQVFPPRKIEMKRPAYWEFSPLSDGSQDIRAATKAELMPVVKQYAKERGVTIKSCNLVIFPGPPAVKVVPFNPGSRDEIAARLMDMFGWKPTKFTDNGKPQVDDDVLKALPYPPAKLLAEHLLIIKRLGQLAEGKQAWLKLEQNGVIYGRVNTNGAVTGRCTHNNPNVAQTPRVGSPYGEECRALFGPPPGWWLVGCDASGLELRCLAHFTARWDGGSYAREILEGDIHTANQKAAGLDKRDQAKTFIYALCYGAGDDKIGTIVGGDGKAGARLKAKFFEAMPALLLLTDAVKAAAGFVKKQTRRGTFWVKPDDGSFRGWIRGLDGRRLHVRSAHAALNTLLQSAGALVMKQGLCLLYDKLSDLGLEHGRDYLFHANIHDEWQIGCRTREIAEQVGQAAVEAIRDAGSHFNFRCPLDGEYKIGRNWKETH